MPRAKEGWRALICAIGFGCALGVHYPIGYIDLSHLAPAWLGILIFAAGIILANPRRSPENSVSDGTLQKSPSRLDETVDGALN